MTNKNASGMIRSTEVDNEGRRAERPGVLFVFGRRRVLILPTAAGARQKGAGRRVENEFDDGVQLMFGDAAAIIDQGEKEKYQNFVDKFKAAKTTDDCYTPPLVYDAVADWVENEYGLNKSVFVRPFWPGNDYQKFDYPPGCVVVDNPPFSLFTEIQKFYLSRGQKFFLFGPSLTLFSSGIKEVCYICTDSTIIYENGATVKTGFSTNLDTYQIRSAPKLYAAIKKAVEATQREKKQKPELPKYIYPAHVATSAIVQKYSKYGIDFCVKPEECSFIRKLDNQGDKTIFGGGFLLSERAAAERAAAIVWELSEREKRIIRAMGSAEPDDHEKGEERLDAAKAQVMMCDLI